MQKSSPVPTNNDQHVCHTGPNDQPHDTSRQQYYTQQNDQQEGQGSQDDGDHRSQPEECGQGIYSQGSGQAGDNFSDQNYEDGSDSGQHYETVKVVVRFENDPDASYRSIGDGTVVRILDATPVSQNPTTQFILTEEGIVQQNPAGNDGMVHQNAAPSSSDDHFRQMSSHSNSHTDKQIHTAQVSYVLSSPPPLMSNNQPPVQCEPSKDPSHECPPSNGQPYQGLLSAATKKNDLIQLALNSSTSEDADDMDRVKHVNFVNKKSSGEEYREDGSSNRIYTQQTAENRTRDTHHLIRYSDRGDITDRQCPPTSTSPTENDSDNQLISESNRNENSEEGSEGSPVVNDSDRENSQSPSTSSSQTEMTVSPHTDTQQPLLVQQQQHSQQHAHNMMVTHYTTSPTYRQQYQEQVIYTKVSQNTT